MKCYGSLRLPRISLLNLRRKKKRNRGFFGGILMDVKGDKNSVAKIPCLKNCWISEVWRSFGSGCFQLHRGANQKMSFTPVPSIARPTDRRRICINWTLRWRFFQQGGGVTSSFLRKPTSFWMCFKNKKIGRKIQFVKERDNQLYIPRTCVWVFDFRSARSSFWCFFWAPLWDQVQIEPIKWILKSPNDDLGHVDAI